MSWEFLRTPDERFQSLPGWPYRPNYLRDLPGYEGMQMHYVDEGPRDAEVTFLCLHGEPSWSYLYRKMIPKFVEAGHRVLAPDWFGFGRSDKPTKDQDYTFKFHYDSALAFFERMDLSNVCLVVQDWGGLLGLLLPVAYPERITRLLVMNTAIGTGRAAGPGFEKWKALVAKHFDFDVGRTIQRDVPALTPEEVAAYDAPFPDGHYKAGVRRFPSLVPVAPEMDGVTLGQNALDFYRNTWSGRSFMAIGMRDIVLGPPVMRGLQRIIRGCDEVIEVPEAGHFVQEYGAPIADAALKYFGLE